MGYEITPDMIIEEYLNNWFTYDELAQYLCIDLNVVIKTLENINDSKKSEKVKKHSFFIKQYYLGKKHIIDDIEYDEKVIKIADYIIETRASIRQTAEYFKIGKSTVFDKIYERLPYIDLFRYRDVFMILMSNKSFTTNNKEITESVLKCAELIISGFTSEEICNVLKINRNVLQRNLTVRLKKINIDLYEEVKKILKERKLEGLNPFERKK